MNPDINRLAFGWFAMKTLTKLSNHIGHFFHLVSNVRPIIWICAYIVLMPVFALIYYWLPDSQFRIPDGASSGYGAWLYYSIVTISTLGFGDYTPAHGWAQAVTAIEVVTGLSIFGFFLNSVGSMKSEIDLESEEEKQKQLHHMGERAKLMQSAPLILHNINIFLSYCYAMTTPIDMRDKGNAEYNPDFKVSDMRDLYKPSGLPIDKSHASTLSSFMAALGRTSLFLDRLQTNIDLTLWPDLLEDCFSFVANYQMFTSYGTLADRMHELVDDGKKMSVSEVKAAISSIIAKWDKPAEYSDDNNFHPIVELYYLIKNNGAIARRIEISLTRISNEQ